MLSPSCYNGQYLLRPTDAVILDFRVCQQFCSICKNYLKKNRSNKGTKSIHLRLFLLNSENLSWLLNFLDIAFSFELNLLFNK